VTDVDLDEDDLDAIEEEMDEIIAADYDIEREVRSREEAKEIYADNEYKLQILDEEADDEEVTFYVQTTGRTSVRAPTSSRRARSGRRPSWRSRRPTGAVTRTTTR